MPSVGNRARREQVLAADQRKGCQGPNEDRAHPPTGVLSEPARLPKMRRGPSPPSVCRRKRGAKRARCPPQASPHPSAALTHLATTHSRSRSTSHPREEKVGALTGPPLSGGSPNEVLRSGDGLSDKCPRAEDRSRPDTRRREDQSRLERHPKEIRRCRGLTVRPDPHRSRGGGPGPTARRRTASTGGRPRLPRLARRASGKCPGRESCDALRDRRCGWRSRRERASARGVRDAWVRQFR